MTGLPANVEASFSPPTLSGGTLASTLVLTALAAASEGSYDVTISGTGAGLATTADLSVDVVSLDVSGRLVSAYDLPLAGVAVRGQGDSAITDANGMFTLSGLSVPYDLAIWNTADEWVEIYQGLTSAEHVLAPFGAVEPSGVTAYNGLVTGALSGGQIPVPADQVVMVCVEGVDDRAVGCDIVQPTEDSYSLPVLWFNDSTRDVRVHALQVASDADLYPLAFPGYASQDLSLTDGEVVAVDLALGAQLGTSTVEVEVSPVEVLEGTIGSVQLGPSLAVPVMFVETSSESHQVLMPDLPDVSYGFVGVADTNRIGWHAGVDGASASVSVPIPVTLTAPADAAVNIMPDAVFTADHQGSGPLSFLWFAGDIIVRVVTMEPTASVPDLTEFGLALPAATQVSWQVVHHGGSTTDDAAYAVGDFFRYQMLLSPSSPGPSGQGGLWVSETREFTTAP